jgi:hypothetical protein
MARRTMCPEGQRECDVAVDGGGGGGEVSGRSVFYRREAREGRDRSADQDWCGSGEEARREQRSGGRMGAAVAREEVRQGGGGGE